MNRSFGAGALAPVVIAMLSTSTQASLTFSFDYSLRAVGTGFLAPMQGAARQQALSTAGNLVSDLFGK